MILLTPGFGHSLFRQRPISIFLCMLLLLSVGVSACGAEPSSYSTPTQNISAAATATSISTLNPTAATTRAVSTALPTVTVPALPTATATIPALPGLTPTNTVTISTLPQDWQSRWLKGIPCRPPCWEGITPGKTTAEEAFKILKQSPLTMDVELFKPTEGQKYSSLDWNWLGIAPKYANFPEGGSVFYDAKPPNHVFDVRPHLPNYHLNEIIQAYGEPSHAIAGFQINPEESSLYYYIYLVYLNQGFMIGTSRYSPGIPSMNLDLTLEAPEFFIPGEDGLERLSPVLYSRKLLVPWQGLKEYRFYCRHTNNPQHVAEDCSKIPGIGGP